MMGLWLLAAMRARLRRQRKGVDMENDLAGFPEVNLSKHLFYGGFCGAGWGTD